MKNKSFVLYTDMCSHLLKLSDGDLASVMRAVIQFAQGEEVSVPLEGVTDIMFGILRDQVQRDQEKYRKTVEARTNAGKKSAQVKKENQSATNESVEQQTAAKTTNVDFVQQKATNATDTVTDNVNDTETVTENVPVNETVSVSETKNMNGTVTGTGNAARKQRAPLQPPAAPPAPMGRYRNLYFSPQEYSQLQAEFPYDLNERVERLSEYIAASGKQYRSHAAILRTWARKDKEEHHGIHTDRDHFTEVSAQFGRIL